MAERYTSLYNRLKPLIMADVQSLVRTRASGAGGGSSTSGTGGGDINTTTGTLPWARVSKTGSSIADLASRSHSLLTGLTADGHTQYVHISTARTITAAHTFNHAGAPFAIGANSSGRLVTGLNADQVDGYHETTFMRRDANSNLDMNGYQITSDDGNVSYLFSHLVTGSHSAGATWVGLRNRALPSAAGSAMILQSDSGQTLLNAASGQNISFRNDNTAVATLDASNLTINSPITVKSNNYASQTTGWGLTYGGAFDARYIFTDEMHTKSFVADLEQALAGGQIISKSVATLSRDFTAPAAGGTTTLYVNDLPSASNMAVFVSGDIIQLRQFSRASGSLAITNCWGTVTSYSDLSGGEQSWTFTRTSGADAGAMSAGYVVEADSIVLDYGTTGNGYYEVNAIDGAYGANSPYMQIVTWTTHPRSGKTVRARFGNLAGLGVSDYGIRMGTDVSAAATTTFDFRASTGATTLGPVGSGKPNLHFDGTDLHMRQNTTNVITLASSGDSYFSGVMTIGTSGEIRQGTGTLGSNFTGLRLWRDSSIGRIGGYNSNTLQWYGATDGKLYAGGGYIQLAYSAINMQSTSSAAMPQQIKWWKDITDQTGSPVGIVGTYSNGVFMTEDITIQSRGSSAYNASQTVIGADTYAGGSFHYFSIGSWGSIYTTAAYSLTEDAPTLGSNWTNRTSENLSARIFASHVEIIGIIDGSSTPSSTLATLATPYRPAKRRFGAVTVVNGGTSTSQRVDIETDGDITAQNWTPASGDAVLFGLHYFL